MKVSAAILKRRSFRSLEPVEITESIIKELVSAANLAPSCYNNQPCRFVFAKSSGVLDKIKKVLKKGNEWAYNGSCIAAVLSRRDLDCVAGDKEFYLFDSGISIGQLILKATEMGLVAHIIAGFDAVKAKKVLSIPEEWNLIVLIIIGKRSRKKLEISDENRPERLSLKYIYSIDEYSKKLNKKVKH